MSGFDFTPDERAAAFLANDVCALIEADGHKVSRELFRAIVLVLKERMEVDVFPQDYPESN